jgi:serine protease Do
MTGVPFEEEMIAAVDRIRPAVVQVRRPIDPKRRRRGSAPLEGAGTGLAVSQKGLVVTNSHVVRDGRHVNVSLSDGRELLGEVVGDDPATDLALIRVPAEDLPEARMADSSRVRVGQFALAIGNSLGLPGAPTMSLGVVSAIGRALPGSEHVFEGLLQTDAAINPGNSGGPLADLHGEVIGINAAMIAYAQGVGFAIPSNTVRRVVEHLREHGRLVRPWLGISGRELDLSVRAQFGVAAGAGILIMDTVDGGPADRSGLRPGDVIEQVGPWPVRTLRDLLGAVGQLPVGGTVDLGIRRGAERLRPLVQLKEAPPLEAA